MSLLKLELVADVKADQLTIFEFTLKNNSEEAISFDKFCFTTPQPILKETWQNTDILLRQGSYYEVKGPVTPIEAGAVWEFSVKGDIRVNHYTDLPATVFVVTGDDAQDVEYTKQSKIAARVFEPFVPNLKPSGAGKSRGTNCFPLPNSLMLSGKTVDLSQGFNVNADDIFKDAFGNAAQIEQALAGDNQLFQNSNGTTKLNITHDTALPNEGYTLNITDSVNISAKDNAGAHNALMSLWQIAIVDPKNTPCVNIEDAPRFEYRGQMLDVVRQFYTVSEVKRFINHMAIYKLNKFHWHLVDDEAWRIEIKALPELTEKLAFRGYNELVEPQFGTTANKSGGFYTQDDIKDIVDFAAKRNIEVIPEIDIPGHCYGLIKAMPELLEAGDKSDYRSVQGFANNVLNPGLPATYDVLDKVFAEVASLFPSKHVHMGADERAEGSWEKSPKVSKLMSETGANSTEQIQTYFLNKVQDIAAKYGKTTGAWEEASLQGDIKKDGYVVSWRGIEAGLDAAERGYDVVMAPVHHCYFDVAQSYDFEEPGLSWAGTRVGLQDTYDYNAAPNDMAENLRKHIKGVQGCLWGENLYDKSIVDYQMFPRMIALSEICWTNVENKDFKGFKADLSQYHKTMLDNLEINYRKKDFA